MFENTNLDCISSLITQVERLTLVDNVLVDCLINQHFDICIVLRGAKLPRDLVWGRRLIIDETYLSDPHE